MSFNLREGARDISECYDFKGFNVGTIIIYNTDKNPFPYDRINYNGGREYIPKINHLPTPTYTTFDLTLNLGGLKTWQEVELIEFSKST